MNRIVSRLITTVFLLPCVGSVATGQQLTWNAMGNNDLQQFSAPHRMAPNPPLSATGQSYWGFDLGLTYSWYLGQNNFFWPVNDVANNILAPLPFDNLGGGLGGILGVKAGIPLTHSVDLEGKLRYLTNYTSATETHNLFVTNTGGQVPVTYNYTALLNNLDLAAILHFAISDRSYAAGGLSFSGLLGNRFSAVQTLPPGTVYNNTSGYPTGIVQETVPAGSQSSLFNLSRLDLQLGAGTVFPMSTVALDAELLVSVPLTAWLQSSNQAGYNQFADTYNAYVESRGSNPVLSHPTFPNLWYASLTIGIRFPFEKPREERVAYASSEIPGTHKQQGIGTDEKVALIGSVRDSKTGRPIDATMTVVDLTTNQVVATDETQDGKYNIRVNAPGKYSVTADANGYLFGTAYFQVADQGRVLSNHPDITLSETVGGRTRLLVFFDFNSADLTAASYPELDRAVRLMKAMPTMKVQIAGYTDSVGTDEYNRDLSQRRANAVRDYIVHHGIQKNRVAAHGYGKDSPIADNGTEDGRAENRRVEFVVLSD